MELRSSRPVPTSPPVAVTLPAWDAEGERRLVEALRRGEEAAYESVVRDCGPRLLAVARRILRNEEDARDSVQEAFLQAFRGLSGFAGECRLSSWLHKIVVNAALMKARSRARRPEESIDALMPTFDETGHQRNPSAWREGAASELLERREMRHLVREKIGSLPESWRTVLVLRDIEELSPEESARLLEVSTNVVKVRLHRARQALRSLLDEHFRKVLS